MACGAGNRWRGPGAGLLRGVAAALAAGWLTGAAGAQGLADPELQLEDVIEIELIGRDLLAYDLLGSGTPSLRLEIGEQVEWMRASGRVGVVVTDRRLLAITNTNGSWQEERFRVHETRPAYAHLGKRVALVVTSMRLLGYDSRSGSWLSRDIGPNERVTAARAGSQTALVLTNRTAYGLSPDAGGFVSVPISVQERIEGVRVGANTATVSTSRRTLVFRAPVGVWTEERRKIN